MSKVGQMIMEIEDLILSGMDDSQIVASTGCPVNWVEDVRKQIEENEMSLAYATNSYDCPALNAAGEILLDDEIPF